MRGVTTPSMRVKYASPNEYIVQYQLRFYTIKFPKSGPPQITNERGRRILLTGKLGSDLLKCAYENGAR